jgi:hypothetical protein
MPFASSQLHLFYRERGPMAGWKSNQMSLAVTLRLRLQELRRSGVQISETPLVTAIKSKKTALFHKQFGFNR